MIATIRIGQGQQLSQQVAPDETVRVWKADGRWHSAVQGESATLSPGEVTLDPFYAAALQRDQDGRIWRISTGDYPLEDHFSCQLPDPPGDEHEAIEQGWQLLRGEHDLQLAPREALAQHQLELYLDNQRGAVADRSCGKEQGAEMLRLESGIEVKLVPWKGVHVRGEEADSGELIEALGQALIDEQERSWIRGSAWLELVLCDMVSGELSTIRAARFESGPLCSCNLREMALSTTRHWLGELRHDGALLVGVDAELDIIGAGLIIPGVPGELVPEVHLMCGTYGVDIEALAKEQALEGRVLN